MCRWLAGTLAVAALAPLALPAPALADRSFTTTGSITYTWHGDPARGCAAEGLCAVQGALILSSHGLSSASSGGPPRGPIQVPLDPGGSTARVSDGPGAGECIDVPTGLAEPSNLLIARPAGALVGHVDASLSSGRCAGPLPQDLAAIPLSVRRSGGKHPAFDLSGSQSFTAGPFSGTLVSTLVVREGTNGGGSESVTGSIPVGTQPSHKVLLERVTLHYSVSSLPGTLDAAFSGEPDPFCAALDSCGASGTLALSLPRFGQNLTVVASRTVGMRVNAGQAMADLRRGRLHVEGGFGPPGTRPTAAVAETFAGPGGFGCHDTAVDPQATVVLEPGSARSGAAMTLTTANPVDSDLVRTYCPGPSGADVFGDSQALARGSVGFPELLDHRSVVSLTAPGTFAGFGYVGRRGGALRFSLTLEHVSAGTVEVTRP